MSNYKKIHLYVPNMFEYKGGIQVFSKFLLEALMQEHLKLEIDVFVKHDHREAVDFSDHPNLHFHCYGHYPLVVRTVMFALSMFFYGMFRRPNLIITTHVNFSPLCYLLACLKRVRYWVVAHGVEVWGLGRGVKRHSIKNADRILAVSTYTRDRLKVELSIPDKQILVLPNTFREERFGIHQKPVELLARHMLAPQQPVILTVARLDSDLRYKGYDQILHALPKVVEAIPEVHYVLLGKGGDAERIKRLITQLRIEQHVTLAGFVPDEELAKYYDLCDIFAMPSQGEGFGIVFLEALASGKPCVSGNADGSTDPLARGKRGVQVPPTDQAAVADALIAVLNRSHPNQLLYDPKALRESVISEFGFSVFKDQVSQLFFEDASHPCAE